MFEGYDDGGDPGCGAKLLHLLQRWDVQNVLLVVSVWEDGLPHRLRGQRYKIVLDRAKLVLEQCYEDAVAAGHVSPRPEEQPAANSGGAAGAGSGDAAAHAFAGADLVALRDGQLAAPAKV